MEIYGETFGEGQKGELQYWYYRTCGKWPGCEEGWKQCGGWDGAETVYVVKVDAGRLGAVFEVRLDGE